MAAVEAAAAAVAAAAGLVCSLLRSCEGAEMKRLSHTADKVSASYQQIILNTGLRVHWFDSLMLA